jgi:hypothetical protein
MKHLDKFYNYIIENNSFSFDMEEIKEYLRPMEDIGIKTTYNQDNLEVCKKGDDEFYNSIMVTFEIPGENFSIRSKWNSSDYEVLQGDSFWEFLNEFMSFRDRLSDNNVNCLVRIFNNYGSYKFVVILLGEKNIKEVGDKALTVIYNKISTTSHVGRTDFAYDTICYLKDDHIIIKNGHWSYTDRKLIALIKRSGVDVKTINIEKIEDDDDIMADIINKITLK